jgi:hypothetical protein
MAKAKDKKEKDDVELDESEVAPEAAVDQSPKSKISDEEFEKIKDQARQEVLHDIQRGALAVPKAVFHKDAKSVLTPVKASVAHNLKHNISPNEEELPKGSNDLVELNLDERLFVNGKELFGKVIVKRHEAESLKHMIQQKKLMDHESTIGRNFLSRKLASGAIEVKEVQDVQEELNKHVGKK